MAGDEGGEEKEDNLRDPVVIQLDGVPNLRDLGGYATEDGGRVRPGMLYRSAKLTDASEADRAFLCERVRTVVDLRDPGEIERDRPGCVREDAAREKAPCELLAVPGPQFRVLTPASPTAALGREALGLREGEQAVVRVPLAARKGMARAVVGHSSWGEVLRMGYHKLFSNTAKLDTTVHTVVDRIGMAGLNRCLVDRCGDSIAAAVSIVADPECRPVLYGCSHGRDRSGVLTYFVLSVLGVPLEQVVRDYERTAALVPPQLLDTFPAEYGPQWRESPAEVMRDTARYVDERYGGPAAYLEAHGISRALQEAMREALVEQKQ